MQHCGKSACNFSLHVRFSHQIQYKFSGALVVTKKKKASYCLDFTAMVSTELWLNTNHKTKTSAHVFCSAVQNIRPNKLNFLSYFTAWKQRPDMPIVHWWWKMVITILICYLRNRKGLSDRQRWTYKNIERSRKTTRGRGNNNVHCSIKEDNNDW